MPFVADASVVAAWLLPDENDSFADQVLARLESDDALVPDLLWHEIRNILVSAERRKRFPERDIVTSLLRLQTLPIRTVPLADHMLIIHLAQRYRLSAYDAAYLGVAVAHQAPLATLDAKLANAAMSEKILLVLS